MRNSLRILVISLLLVVMLPICLHGQKGSMPLPNWEKGMLDIHFINTGCGECEYIIMPDGTTLLVDAGENNANDPRHVKPRPNNSKTPGEWIVEYINDTSPEINKGIDYILVSHFHSDHCGAIAKVAESLNVRKIIDRGYPTYDFIVNQDDKTVKRYLRYLLQSPATRKIERFDPGSDKQFIPLYCDSLPVPFSIRNVYGNGYLWTGVDNEVRFLFPDINSIPKYDMPQENSLSCVIKIQYGDFSFYTGGDVTGYPKPGRSNFHDIETPMADIIGHIDVLCVNHHGYNNATNEKFLRATTPRVLIIQASDALHPDHSVLERMLSGYIYKGERDIFSTNLHPSSRIVIGKNAERMKSTQGHIVVRVNESGTEYTVYVLNDSSNNRYIKKTYGPYKCGLN